jgi:hypothetical protein
MKQMKIGSQENVDNENANKCSLWRHYDFFSSLLSLVYPLPKLHLGTVFYQKAMQTFSYKPFNI